jgi:hypothetical protein
MSTFSGAKNARHDAIAGDYVCFSVHDQRRVGTASTAAAIFA